MNARRARGFTMIELMIVVVIVAVLATIALPNLQDVVARTRLKTAASDLHTSLVFARSEAIKRNCQINVVPAIGGWVQGWSVKTDLTCPQPPPNPPAEIVLTKQDAYQQIAFRTADAANATITLASLSFAGTGRCAIANCPGVAFVLTATNYPLIQARCVLLDPSGRPAVRMDRDTNPLNGCN